MLSLRYSKDIANLLFWVRWACLATTKVILSFEENFCVYLQVKNRFHSPFISGVTAKICKLILSALGMPDYTQPK